MLEYAQNIKANSEYSKTTNQQISKRENSQITKEQKFSEKQNIKESNNKTEDSNSHERRETTKRFYRDRYGSETVNSRFISLNTWEAI